MPSAPPADRSPWPRRLTLAAITVALASATYHPVCSAVFGCGCSWFFAGAADTCDIHVAGPPDCPVCTQVPAGAAFSAAMLAGWGVLVGVAARRVRPIEAAGPRT